VANKTNLIIAALANNLTIKTQQPGGENAGRVAPKTAEQMRRQKSKYHHVILV